jgi:hypothetical protein
VIRGGRIQDPHQQNATFSVSERARSWPPAATLRTRSDPRSVPRAPF